MIILFADGTALVESASNLKETEEFSYPRNG